MNVDQILELTWVPIIVFAMSFGYGLLLIITKNPKALLSKKAPQTVKNSEKYAVEGGKLLVFLSVGSLINCGLLFVSPLLAVLEAAAWFFIFALLWKKVSDQYGPL